MKKIISGLLAVAGIAAFAGAAGATGLETADTSATIRFETVTLNETSETVAIDVYIENNPGFVSATIPVTWDDTVLKLTDIQDYDATITSGWVGYSEYSEITDTYYLAWNNDTIHDGSYGKVDFTEDGKLCTMVFEVLDAVQNDTVYAISADLEDPIANMMNWDMEDFLHQRTDDGIYGVVIEFVDGGIVVSGSKLGDIDGDGEITPADRMALARHIANWEGYETINTAAADIDKDGEITPNDRLILARHIAAWEGYEDLASFANGN